MRFITISIKGLLRFVYIILCVVIILIAAYFSVSAKSAEPSDIPPQKAFTIIIDPGHGGFDGGAVANDGTVEKDINLQIALKLGEFLEISGYKVVFTRTTDIGTDNLTDATIAQRKKDDIANRLDLMYRFKDAVYVSIHLNNFHQTSANGAQVFYSPNNTESKLLSELIQSSVANTLQLTNKRVVKKADKNIYLLYNAPIPAVIVECGFLSNLTELEMLKKEEYQAKIAFAIYNGILKYYSS